jgi:hypothetical protein
MQENITNDQDIIKIMQSGTDEPIRTTVKGLIIGCHFCNMKYSSILYADFSSINTGN